MTRHDEYTMGTGWVFGGIATALGMAIVYAIGETPNIGITFGTIGFGLYKMWRNRP